MGDPISREEWLANRAMELTIECATMQLRLLADLMATLVERGVLRSGDIRDVVLRSKGVIEHSPPDALARSVFPFLLELLRERLHWPPESAELRVLKPLPEAE